ncbi:MAG TPA: hypothetical protein VK841_20145 [Polyangiaceae bacterium]|nr:hypothetical protein [Polyangiaceae bacterium]
MRRCFSTSLAEREIDVARGVSVSGGGFVVWVPVGSGATFASSSSDCAGTEDASGEGVEGDEAVDGDEGDDCAGAGGEGDDCMSGVADVPAAPGVFESESCTHKRP